MYNEGPTNGKWLWAGVGFLFFFMVGAAVGAYAPEPYTLVAVLPFGISLLLAIDAVRLHFAYFYRIQTSDDLALLDARNHTPDVLIFEAAQTMNPRTVELLLLHRKHVMALRRGRSPDNHFTVAWVLEEAPTVHLDFISHVLQNSSNYQLMSKRILSEGSKRFDPEGLVSDRQQYDDLVNCMIGWLMVTKPFGNSSPPAWIPPYNPEICARELELWEDEVKGESNEPKKEDPETPIIQ